jgi:hypothetical protein
MPSLLAEFVSYLFRDLEDDKPILATDEDRRIFAEALINPPEPGEGLRKAQEAYLKSGIIDGTN